MTRRLFEVQVVTSVSNIVLNLAFVLGLGMDVDGVALGTLIAAYLGLGFGLWRARQRIAALMPELAARAAPAARPGTSSAA